MKQAFKIRLLILLITASTPYSYAQDTITDTKFTSALNKVINNFPQFNKLRGKDITLRGQYGTIYKSKEDLAGFEKARVWSVVVYGILKTDWTASISISDSIEAINAYNAISKKITFSKFDCCSLIKKETNDDHNRETEWTPGSIYEENDKKKFNRIKVSLKLLYHSPTWNELILKVAD